MWEKIQKRSFYNLNSQKCNYASMKNWKLLPTKEITC